MATAPAHAKSGAPLEVERLAGSLGAEVRGIDLAKATAEDAAALRALLLEHLVLFFPDQHLGPDEHIAFGRLFGPLDAHPNLGLGGERPEFFELRATSGAGAIADEWHSDLTCQERPSIFAILHMRTCPAFGGDTMWANAVKAFEALSPPMQAFCEGLSALHDAGPHGRPEVKAIHPVVRVHPETGRKSLFVNHHFTRRIVELSQEESDMLLAHLTRWVTSPRFTVRYRWREGTIAMWDNRCTQHHVLDDFEGERVIQRVTVMGDEPRAASPSPWSPYSTAFSAASWRDNPLRQFLAQRRERTERD
ncbi:MAG: TauD/TfdA family dioxygenase [Myxococcota bacterium]|nr:TauD/TfdA family dioxygenase [Myxococcales bacterium]